MAEKTKSGTKFTAKKFSWLDQIAGDHELISSCLHVAYHISRWFKVNTKEGVIEGWRSQDHLARDSGLSVTGVRNAIAELIARNHLEVTKGNGRTHASTYTMVLSTERVKPSCTLISEKAQPELPLSDNQATEKGASGVQERCKWGAEKGASGVATNPLQESFEESLEYISPKKTLVKKSRSGLEEEFEEVWIHYPRKKSKVEALKAFEKARERIDRSTIMNGVLRYAAERHDEDPKFTKHFATWLNAACWEDEPTPRRQSGMRDALDWLQEENERRESLENSDDLGGDEPEPRQ